MCIRDRVIHYQFIDEPTERKNYYYRLKIIDKDGTYEYSGFIVHKTTCESRDISIFPNPTTDVAVIADISKNSEIQIISPNGKIIQSVRISDASFTLDLSHLPAGIYFMKIQTDDSFDIHFEKIIKM